MINILSFSIISYLLTYLVFYKIHTFEFLIGIFLAILYQIVTLFLSRRIEKQSENFALKCMLFNGVKFLIFLTILSFILNTKKFYSEQLIFSFMVVYLLFMVYHITQLHRKSLLRK